MVVWVCGNVCIALVVVLVCCNVCNVVVVLLWYNVFVLEVVRVCCNVCNDVVVILVWYIVFVGVLVLVLVWYNVFVVAVVRVCCNVCNVVVIQVWYNVFVVEVVLDSSNDPSMMLVHDCVYDHGQLVRVLELFLLEVGLKGPKEVPHLRMVVRLEGMVVFLSKWLQVFLFS
ncbi:hypothetical protein HanPI659440_Chr06g0229901 [Helianthus annuus]|nr:hypothetical protein HanPI659440_Chr06g0229901 [Helianthus annuus]